MFLCLKIVYTSFMATSTVNILIQHQHFAHISSNFGRFEEVTLDQKPS